MENLPTSVRPVYHLIAHGNRLPRDIDVNGIVNARVEAAHEFFSTEHRRTKRYQTSGDTDSYTFTEPPNHLAHVPREHYDDRNLSYDSLQEEDRALADRLLELCHASNRHFGLYFVQAKYRQRYEVHHKEEMDETLESYGPWIQLVAACDETKRLSCNTSYSFDLAREVPPVGQLEEMEDFDETEDDDEDCIEGYEESSIPRT